jgi:hypothetical protein
VHAARDFTAIPPPRPTWLRGDRGGAIECLLAQPRVLAGAARPDRPAGALGDVDQLRLAARVSSNAWARRRAAIVAWATADADGEEGGADA